MANKRNANNRRGKYETPDTKARRAVKKTFKNGKFPKRGNQGPMTSRDESLEATNNPQHYLANPGLVDLAGRVPFTNPLGAGIDYIRRSIKEKITIQSTAYKALRSYKSVAGIQVLETIPTFGYSEDATSGLNMAMQAYYTWVRQINSGSRNYDPPDLFTYFMSMSSLYSMINWCQRVYGCIKQFNLLNKYLARTLVEAMGVNYDDIANNMLAYLSRLNLNISKIAAFSVPGNMDFFAHVASMYLDIYCDSDNIKDQIYMYNPAGFYKFEFDTSELPRHEEAYLRFYPLTSPDSLLTMDDIFAYLEDMIDRIMYSQDLGVMSGDTLKAYGAAGLIKLAEVPSDYRTLFKHDLDVLLQMKNATIVGVNYNVPDLYQDDSKTYLLFKPELTKTYTTEPGATVLLQDFGVALTKIMSVEGADPDPAHVFEYSRLMVTGDLVKKSDPLPTYVMKLINGADIVYRLHTYRLCYTDNGVPDGYDHQYWGSAIFDVSANVASAQTVSTTLCAFNYAPFVAMVNKSTNGDLVYFADVFHYDNFAIITDEQLKQMHDVAMYNMLAHKQIQTL